MLNEYGQTTPYLHVQNSHLIYIGYCNVNRQVLHVHMLRIPIPNRYYVIVNLQVGEQF